MRQALELALEALNTTESDCGSRAWEREQEAIDAIKEALAQPEQEPVAWVRRHPDGAFTAEFLENAVIEPVRKKSGAWFPLYTIPPQRKPLSDEDATFKSYLKDCDEHLINPDVGSAFHFAWQAAHGIGENT